MDMDTSGPSESLPRPQTRGPKRTFQAALTTHIALITFTRCNTADVKVSDQLQQQLRRQYPELVNADNVIKIKAIHYTDICEPGRHTSFHPCLTPTGNRTLLDVLPFDSRIYFNNIVFDPEYPERGLVVMDIVCIEPSEIEHAIGILAFPSHKKQDCDGERKGVVFFGEIAKIQVRDDRDYVIPFSARNTPTSQWARMESGAVVRCRLIIVRNLENKHPVVIQYAHILTELEWQSINKFSLAAPGMSFSQCLQRFRQFILAALAWESSLTVKQYDAETTNTVQAHFCRQGCLSHNNVDGNTFTVMLTAQESLNFKQSQFVTLSRGSREYHGVISKANHSGRKTEMTMALSVEDSLRLIEMGYDEDGDHYIVKKDIDRKNQKKMKSDLRKLVHLALDKPDRRPLNTMTAILLGASPSSLPVHVGPPGDYIIDTASTLGNHPLNNEQQDFANRVLENHPPVSILRSGPGCGKTGVFVRLAMYLIMQGAQLGKRVRLLIGAPSNNAVLTLVEKFTSILESNQQLKSLVEMVAVASSNRELLPNQKNVPYLHQIVQDLKDKTEEQVETRFQEVKRVLEQIRKLEEELTQKIEEQTTSIKNGHQQFFKNETRETKNKIESLKKKIQPAMLNALNPNVIFSTVVTMLSPTLNGYHFDYILIDEACKTTESSVFLTLLKISTTRKNLVFDNTIATRCLILGGDPNQLGPLIRATGPTKQLTKNNAIENLPLTQPELQNFLKIQNRMHPRIAKYPNERFYNKELQNGCNESDRQTSIEHFAFPVADVPLLWIHAEEEEQINQSKSYSNDSEINIVIDILKVLNKAAIFKGLQNILVITQYESQKMKIQNSIEESFSSPPDGLVMTVDASQGSEAEFVIVSTCRSGDKTGFIDEEQRACVCLTRAKSGLVFVGNSDTLGKSSCFGTMIQEWRQEGLIKDRQYLINIH